MRLAYCDYIAHTIIKPALDKDAKNDGGVVAHAGSVFMDLHEEGYMVSTAKSIECLDVNGKKYKITIEEV